MRNVHAVRVVVASCVVGGAVFNAVVVVDFVIVAVIAVEAVLPISGLNGIFICGIGVVEAYSITEVSWRQFKKLAVGVVALAYGLCRRFVCANLKI